MGNVLEMGEICLRKVSKSVDDVFSKKTQRIIDEMIDALLDKKGIGIAAPQIGYNERIFIVAPNQKINAPYDSIDTGLIVINPSISFLTKKESLEWEGCLSIPGFRGLVSRACDIKITYTNCHGEVKSERYKDFTARIFLHEYDHLEGVLFLDRIKNFKDHLITDAVYMARQEEDIE
jgi:peptide deformylase